jgi:hypothetical protein
VPRSSLVAGAAPPLDVKGVGTLEETLALLVG